jgi:hypothetical protein
MRDFLRLQDCETANNAADHNRYYRQAYNHDRSDILKQILLRRQMAQPPHNLTQVSAYVAERRLDLGDLSL